MPVNFSEATNVSFDWNSLDVKNNFRPNINFEIFSFENSFNLFYYPWNTFGSVEAFLNNKKITDPDYNPEVDIDFDEQVRLSSEKPYNWSYVDVSQLGIYIQDEWQVNDKFNLTYGLRMDMPIYMNQIPITPAVEEVQNFEGWVDENGDSQKVDPGQWPSSKPLWAPRWNINI